MHGSHRFLVSVRLCSACLYTHTCILDDLEIEGVSQACRGSVNMEYAVHTVVLLFIRVNYRYSVKVALSLS